MAESSVEDSILLIFSFSYSDIVSPYSKYPYALDEISGSSKINVSLIDNNNGAKADIGVLDFTQKDRTVITKKNFDSLFLDYSREGLTTIIKFHYGIRDSDSVNKISSKNNFLKRSTNFSNPESRYFEFKANRVGISIIDHIFNNGIHKELIYMQYEKIFLMFHDTGNSIEVKAKLFDMQVDNKLLGTPFPVLLTTKTEKLGTKKMFNKFLKIMKTEIKEKVLRKEDANTDGFFKFHVILNLTPDRIMNQLNLFKFRVKPLELNIDGNLLEILRKILIYFSQKVLPNFAASRPPLKEEDFSLDTLQDILAEKKAFNEEGLTIQKLIISDINLILNFRNFHAFVKEVSHFYILRLLAIVFNNFGSFILYFDEFLLKNTKIAFDSLVNQLISYYATYLNKQIYWLIANADIIGNPSLFINQISKIAIFFLRSNFE